MNRKRVLFGLGNGQLAQMHTLEAIMASTIMVMIIVFAVQATSLTPLTSSTANAHIEAQLQVIGQDMLSALDYSQYDQRSDLKNDLLNWNGDEYAWSGEFYKSRTNESITLNSSMEGILSFIAIPRGIAHNVQLSHISDTGRFSSIFYIYNGDPSDNAVIISRKVVISNPDIGNTSTFQANTGIVDIDDTTDLYNIIDVKLILWRM